MSIYTAPIISLSRCTSTVRSSTIGSGVPRGYIGTHPTTGDILPLGTHTIRLGIGRIITITFTLITTTARIAVSTMFTFLTTAITTCVRVIADDT